MLQTGGSRFGCWTLRLCVEINVWGSETRKGQCEELLVVQGFAGICRVV